MDLIQFVLTVLIMSFTAEEKWDIFFWPRTPSRIVCCINLPYLFNLLSSVTSPLSVALTFRDPDHLKEPGAVTLCNFQNTEFCRLFPHDWIQALHCWQVLCPSEPHTKRQVMQACPITDKVNVAPAAARSFHWEDAVFLFVTRNFGFPGGSDGKESACQWRRPEFNPWVEKIPWRREWQPTPVFVPGEFHGQTSLVGYSPWGHKESDTTGWLILSLSFK